jgi:hypothetical protein
MYVERDPLGNPVDRRHPWNQHTIPRPQKRNFDGGNYTWVMSPRWYDGESHLALDTGGGPLPRLWATALANLIDIGYVQATGQSVKINFPNQHAVYMHDTPQQSLFTDLDRFHSSGCVRVQNVRDLVTWLLRDTPGWGRQTFEQTIRSGENKPVALAQPVPVYFTYVSAWSTGDAVVHFRDDIYGRDGVDELQLSSTL